MCETRKFIMAILHLKQGLLCDKRMFFMMVGKYKTWFFNKFNVSLNRLSITFDSNVLTLYSIDTHFDASTTDSF